MVSSFHTSVLFVLSQIGISDNLQKEEDDCAESFVWNETMAFIIHKKSHISICKNFRRGNWNNSPFYYIKHITNFEWLIHVI